MPAALGLSANGFVSRKLFDFIVRKAPTGQRFVSLGAELRRPELDAARCAAEPWRRARLHNAVNVDETPSGLVVRMLRRLAEAQHRRETNVGSLHDLAPCIARFGAKEQRSPTA